MLSETRDFFIQKVTFEQTLGLRSQVLRPHLPPEKCVNPEDLEPSSFHLGAYSKAVPQQLIGIASFQKESNSSLPSEHAYRLRGMATDQNFRRLGIGRELVQLGEKMLTEKGCDLLWFNARTVAFEFYESLGFEYYGDLFELPQIGLHKVMYKYLRKSIN